jgi:hypothetical protein
MIETGDRPQKRCLPAAGWAEQCKKFAFVDLETDAGKSLHLSEVLFEINDLY